MSDTTVGLQYLLEDDQFNSATMRPLRADPEPRQRRYTIISVDDHLMEPAHIFEGRMPARLAEKAPKIVEDDKGFQQWRIEDKLVPLHSADAVVSWNYTDLYNGPVRFDSVRKGMWDIKERVRDLDIAGIAASMCFPSMIWGFCGNRFAEMKDKELGLACVQAYNDWIFEEWTGAAPTRIIPMGITWLLDPQIAAQEVRRNADRGFKALSFCEDPEKLGLPSIYDAYWDPLFAVCEETGTVVNLHIGSSDRIVRPSQQSPAEVISKMLTVNSILSTVDWLYAKIPVRFPKIKIVMAESGVGWQPWMVDRLNQQHDKMVSETSSWGNYELTPSEVLYRNFYFTSFFDPNGWKMWSYMDPSKLMIEMDYPHFDSTWPDTQEAVRRQLGDLPEDLIRKATHENASALYRHEVPAEFRTQ